ncbi:MAG: hypothetical protein ACFCGT_24330 [Sandaracinaceae bacterium]
MGRRLLTAVALLALPGCVLANMSRTQNLQDQVHGLNDEAHWSRLDLAVQRVAPPYRPVFALRRAAWGRGITVAASEVSGIRMEGEEGATSTVDYQWYDDRTMLVYETTVEQHWQAEGVSFLLASEEVVRGNADLLPEIQTAGDEAAGDEAAGDEAAGDEAAGDGADPAEAGAADGEHHGGETAAR